MQAFPRWLCLACLVPSLLCPAALPAQSTRRHHKHPSAEDADATPSPTPAPAKTPAPAPSPSPTLAASATATIDPAEIADFDGNPAPVRQLLLAALDLTRRRLTYAYGSADPASGGLDCSGAMYYLLRQGGFPDVPRQANEQYDWVRSRSRFYAVLSKRQDNFELRELRPGDLLFWTGTYQADRDPPVTHTMLYLGQRRRDGHRLMVGASDGRPYDGQRRNGFSVFDFRLPAAREDGTVPDHAPSFAGYGPIPGLSDPGDLASRQAAQSAAPNAGNSAGTPTPSPTPKGKKPRPRRKDEL